MSEAAQKHTWCVLPLAPGQAPRRSRGFTHEGRHACLLVTPYRGASLMGNYPPHYDHRMALGIGLL